MINEDHLEDDQVVVKRYEAAEESERDEPKQAVISAGPKRRAKQIKLPKKSGQWRQTSQRQEKDRHGRGEKWRTRSQSGEILEIVTARLAPNRTNDGKRADQRDCVNAGVKERSRKSVAPAGDDSEQRVTAVRHGRVSEKTSHVGLRKRDEIAKQDRQRGEKGEKGQKGAKGEAVRASGTEDSGKPDKGKKKS